jgi:hypothetical protein
MAIELPRNTVADHVVFDRIVDADRTITLARQAADKAEADGKQEVADKLRAKADALEKVLLATQHPEYDDEEETPPVGTEGEGTQGGSSQNGGQQNQPQQPQDPDQGDRQSDEGPQSDEEGDSEDQAGGGGNEEGTTPEDIANMDQHNGTHSSGTQQIGGGGPSGNSGGGNGSGGQSNSKGGQSNKQQSKGGQKELDPFRLQQGNGNGQQNQPTPEEIMAAVIKRLNGLGGNAKAGADRALRKLFDELGGSGDIDD